MQRVSTYALLEPIFNKITRTFRAKSIADLGGGKYRLSSCNTLWLSPSPNKVLTIAGIQYKIEDLLADEWVVLSGSQAPPLSFDVYAFYFHNNTVIEQSAAIALSTHKGEEYIPLVWLHEITRETFDSNPLNLKERDSECDIYFLVDTKYDSWLTADHERYAVRPMRNLADAFIKELEDQANVNPDFTYQQFDHIKFGEYKDTKGHHPGVFAENLSGTQLRLSIQFYKDLTCSNC